MVIWRDYSLRGGGGSGYDRSSQKDRSWGSSRTSPSSSPISNSPSPSGYSGVTGAMMATAEAGCSSVAVDGCEQAGLKCCRNFHVDPKRSNEVCYNPATHVCSELPFGRGGTVVCPIGQVACNTMTGQCCDPADAGRAASRDPDNPGSIFSQVAGLSQLQHQLHLQQQQQQTSSSAFSAFVHNMGATSSTRDACTLTCTGNSCAGQSCCPHSAQLMAASSDLCYDPAAGDYVCVRPSNFADVCALCPVSAPKACVFQSTGVIGCFSAKTECATILIQG